MENNNGNGKSPIIKFEYNKETKQIEIERATNNVALLSHIVALINYEGS